MKHVYIPRYVRAGITHKNSHFPRRVQVFGGDTETCMGDIEMIQICDGVKTDVLHATPKNALVEFIRHMKRTCHKGTFNVMYFHNLLFDMETMLMPYTHLYKFSKTFTLMLLGVKVEFFLGKICFVNITFSKNRRLMLRDSSKFASGSLARVAQKLKTKHQKMDKPQGLGTRSPWEPDIKAYAIEDAWVSHDVGQWIVDLHRQHDIAICISFSQFSQKLYQKDFVRKGEIIPFPSDDACMFGEMAYKGGKNGLYCQAPAIIQDCYDVDIVSAYAYSLTKMPNVFFAKYVYIEHYEPNADGVFCIDANIKPYPYPILFQAKGFKGREGDVKDMFVTSYELDMALKLGIIQIFKCRGWLIKKSDYHRHPFDEYVNYWWGKKKTATEGTLEYRISKLGPNAIYGKMISKVDVGGFDYVEKNGETLPKDTDQIACMLYNPIVASLVTAKTRLQILRLEMKYGALHTATDSIKTTMTPQPSDLSSDLGGVELEIKGKCIIIRNKLYLHFDEDNVLQKYALHGFWGTADQLLGMVDQAVNTYKSKHMYKLKEVLRMTKKNPKPFMMMDIERELKVNMQEWYHVKADRPSTAIPDSDDLFTI